jgi:hypothetical protein
MMLAIVTACGPLFWWIQRERAWIASREAYTRKENFGSPRHPQTAPPFPLGVFGAKGYLAIFVPDEASDQEFGDIRQLFPEAKVDRWGMHPVRPPSPSDGLQPAKP